MAPTVEDPRVAARVWHLLRAHVLECLALQLAATRLDALLVKGAALALTVYPRPWEREMSDVDIVVRPGTLGAVIRSLEAIGFSALYPRERPLSRGALGEVILESAPGPRGGTILVEAHTQLDKIVARPIDYDEIFGRARQIPELPGLLIPAAEDHALLVALHAAGHDFHHPVAFNDFARLLEQGLNVSEVIERARRWRLGTVMFVFLDFMRRRGDAAIPAALLRAFVPGRLRRGAVTHLYLNRTMGGRSEQPPLGWPWVARQTVLRDDLGQWVAGLVRYAALRGSERFMNPR
jgi:Uncharacterised nucleotidyltransferase